MSKIHGKCNMIHIQASKSRRKTFMCKMEIAKHTVKPICFCLEYRFYTKKSQEKTNKTNKTFIPGLFVMRWWTERVKNKGFTMCFC